jgi:hypothetical protein
MVVIGARETAVVVLICAEVVDGMSVQAALAITTTAVNNITRW